MLYRFKSQAAADVIMVEAHAQPILEAIGKVGPKGIVTVDQIPGAIAAIEAAVARDEQRPADAAEGDADDAETQALRRDAVSLRQRAAPFVDLLQRSAAEGKDVVWGV